MKILDRYIFISFIKTFFSVFVILILIFLLQSIWLYISELAGKDLDAVIILKLLFYLTPHLIPMVLPLTILVASIMTFGSFAENYEFAAMKSSGISLQRAMRSLILFISILSVVTFFFANNVIPWSNYKSKNLRYNIKRLKPAMAIVEGMFNKIGEDYNIRVEKKTGENGQNLHGVLIHKKMEKNRGMAVIKAESGKLIGSKSSNILSLLLYDGTLYRQVYAEDYKTRRRKPFIKNEFEAYQFNIDLSEFNNVDLDETHYDDAASMLSVSELRVALDSLSKEFNEDRESYRKTLTARNGIRQVLGKAKKETDQELKARIEPVLDPKKDSIEYHISSLHEFYESYDLDDRQQITNLALTLTQGTIRTVEARQNTFAKKNKRINKTEIQIHDKYALAVMCFVLFFIGAPLGAIIRKGGIGTPMVVAILLFLTYYYIGLFAKNSAENGSISPFIATWLSTFIMLPLSIIVTYRATTDQGIVNIDGIISPIKNFFAKIGGIKNKKKDNNS